MTHGYREGTRPRELSIPRFATHIVVFPFLLDGLLRDEISGAK
jgi:hypothetical protein